MNADEVRKFKKFLNENECRKEYLKNFKFFFHPRGNESTFEDFLDYMRGISFNAGDLIGGAFLWASTPQGSSFWSDLVQKLHYEIEKLKKS